MTKTCAACAETKPLTDYGRDKRRSDGLNPYCRVCVNRKSRERYAANETHREQVKARSARWHEANPDKSRQAAADWRARNPEKLKARKAAQYAANKDEIVTTLRDAAYRRKYGITLAQRDQLAEVCESRCGICLRHEDELGKRLAVDHDHETGAIRGLLCGGCNTGIGHFRDNPQLLEAAAYYLRLRDGSAETHRSVS